MKKLLAFFIILLFIQGCWYPVDVEVEKEVPVSRMDTLFIPQLDTIWIVTNVELIETKFLNARTTLSDSTLALGQGEIYILKWEGNCSQGAGHWNQFPYWKTSGDPTYGEWWFIQTVLFVMDSDTSLKPLNRTWNEEGIYYYLFEGDNKPITIFNQDYWMLGDNSGELKLEVYKLKIGT